MINSAKPDEDSVSKFMATVVEIEQQMMETRKAVFETSEALRKSTKMLELAMDVIIAVAQDETAELRIRRRLLFAIQQIRGVSQQN